MKSNPENNLLVSEINYWKLLRIPITVLMLGLTLAASLFMTIWNQELEQARIVFEKEALGDLSTAIINKISLDIAVLEDIEALFLASDFVSQEEFRIFVSHELGEKESIQALEWIPYVRDRDREAFEETARKNGLIDFQFTERSSQGIMIPREKQDAYFPVYYLEPLAGNEAALGFDLASSPPRLEALNMARDTGEMVASAPLMLVQETGEQSGFLVFLPIYKVGEPINTVEERRANLEGFALGVFRTDDLVESALIGLTEENIHFHIIDMDSPQEDQIIFESHTKGELNTISALFTASKIIDVGGRSWQIEFFADPEFAVQHQSNSPWVSLIGGILLSSMMSFYLYSSGKQTFILQTQEAKFRTLLETAPDAMVIFTLDGKITLVNEQTEKMFGYQRHEIIDQNFTTLLSRQAQSLFQKIEFESMKTESTLQQFFAVRKNGSKFPVSIKINPLQSGGQVLISSSIRDITEIKQAQDALLESEAKYRDIFEHSSDMIQSVDPQGRFIFVNQVWVDKLGYAESEIGEVTLWDIIHPDSLTHCETIFSKVLNNEIITKFEAVFLTKSGKSMIIEGNIAPKNVDGQVVATHVFCRDVTESRRIQEEIKQVADNLTQLIDTANAPIFGIDVNGMVNEWNQTAVRITGFNKDEVLGQNLVNKYITDDYKESVKYVLNNALKGKETENYEFPLYTKQGERILILLNATTRRDVQGEIIGVFGVGQDITELDKNRLEVEQIADDLTQLIDTANALIVAFDAEGRITEWNRACVEALGYTHEEMLGKKLPHLFPEEVRSEQAKTIAAVQKGKALSGIHLILNTLEGAEKIFSVNVNPRFDETKNVIGAVAVGQDITELDAYRENLEDLVEERTLKLEDALRKLKEADRLKSEFLSTAAHELRTPLTTIQGFSEIMLTRKLKKDRRDHFLTMINEQSTGLGKIIDDLLDLTRLESGRGLEISSELVDVEKLIISVVAGFVDVTPNHEIKVIQAETPPRLKGDLVRLTQVGQNLISNAIKYSPEGGEIKITCQVKEGYLLLSVKDNGIGMTEEQQKHLFEKFYRADASNTSISGTGLGLVITKQIVELHGGEIWVESEFGKGTTVFVKLPMEKN